MIYEATNSHICIACMIYSNNFEVLQNALLEQEAVQDISARRLSALTMDHKKFVH